MPLYLLKNSISILLRRWLTILYIKYKNNYIYRHFYVVL